MKTTFLVEVDGRRLFSIRFASLVSTQGHWPSGSGCFVRKSVLLWRTFEEPHFFKALFAGNVAQACNSIDYCLYRYMIFLFWAMQASEKKPALPDIVCNFAFCSMCCIFFGQLLRCAAQTHSTLLCTSTIFHTCLKTPGGFLSFQTERGLVYELRLCFKDGPFFQKECGIVPQSSSVSLGFKTIYFHFSWCLPDKKKDNYCLWKVHDLNLSFEILHVMLHTYSVATNASKWRYISCSLFWGGISSWNLQHVEPIVLKECILQLNMCFSLGQASSF